MSLWQYASAVEGYRKANSAEDEKLEPPTPQKFEEMKARHARMLH